MALVPVSLNKKRFPTLVSDTITPTGNFIWVAFESTGSINDQTLATVTASAGIPIVGGQTAFTIVGSNTGTSSRAGAYFAYAQLQNASGNSGTVTIALGGGATGTEFGWRRSSWLDGRPQLTTRDPAELITVLRTQPLGEVSYYQEGESTPKSGRLQLEHDAIEVIAWGKVATLYYWDDAARGYDRVITAD